MEKDAMTMSQRVPDGDRASSFWVLGVLVVRGRRWLERWSSGRRGRWVLAALPLASAAAVTILGALMTLVAAWAL